MNHTKLHEFFPMLPGNRVQAIIDPAALTRNYRALMAPVWAVSPHTYAIAVVKADAYGHGILPVVTALLAAGCRSFAVACLEEAVALRTILSKIAADRATDVLVLGYVDPQHAALLSAYDITVTLLSEDYAERLQACAEQAEVTVRVHAALDTGMNRIGYPAHSDTEIRDTVDALLRLRTEPRADGKGGLVLDGLFTHFARADEDYDAEMNTEDSMTLTQFSRYRRVLAGLTERGVRPRVCHVCNSAAAIRFPHALPEGCLDAVRLGISLYGYGVDTPRGAEDATAVSTAGIKPVMRLETVVTHVHTLLPGETVGYGGTFSSDRPRTLATLSLGYADGWMRAFSGVSVTFHTREGDVTAPIVGRICMDQCMADVTGLPVTAGTAVTLFGQTREQLESLAAHAHTIPYEILCLISARVPRVYP